MARPKAAAPRGMLRLLPAACGWRVTRTETVPPTGHTQILSLTECRPSQFALDLGSKARADSWPPRVTDSCFLLPSSLGHIVRRAENRQSRGRAGAEGHLAGLEPRLGHTGFSGHTQLPPVLSLTAPLKCAKVHAPVCDLWSVACKLAVSPPAPATRLHRQRGWCNQGACWGTSQGTPGGPGVGTGGWDGTRGRFCSPNPEALAASGA